jgi:hypothetical protein
MKQAEARAVFIIKCNPAHLHYPRGSEGFGLPPLGDFFVDSSRLSVNNNFCTFAYLNHLCVHRFIHLTADRRLPAADYSVEAPACFLYPESIAYADTKTFCAAQH